MIQVHVARLDDIDKAIEVLAPMGSEAPRVDRPTRSIAVPVANGSARLLDAVRALDGMGLAVSDIGLRRATLDEVFLTLTGRPAEDAPESGPADKSRRSRRAKESVR